MAFGRQNLHGGKGPNRVRACATLRANSMTEHRSHLHFPVAASTFAGVLGAGLVDTFAVLTRGQHGQVAQVLALTVGIYGTVGLLAAAPLGWGIAMVPQRNAL